MSDRLFVFCGPGHNPPRERGHNAQGVIVGFLKRTMLCALRCFRTSHAHAWYTDRVGGTQHTQEWRVRIEGWVEGVFGGL